uniref:Uncharacterized protein n=1 Tax=Rhizophora mucronata TaxID=61149 RepID=A0A2P2NH08_RHIMU
MVPRILLSKIIVINYVHQYIHEIHNSLIQVCKC